MGGAVNAVALAGHRDAGVKREDRRRLKCSGGSVVNHRRTADLAGAMGHGGTVPAEPFGAGHHDVSESQ